MLNWMNNLQEQYQAKIGDPGLFGFPKSHWLGCDRGSKNPDRRIELPLDAPADFVSCNSCLIREGYIRILPCNPREVGWPHQWCRCDKCEYGLDCETWCRVRGIGEKVALATDSHHLVTWADAGLVPFHKGDLFFPDKRSLDYFMASLAERYPGHFDPEAPPCDCIPSDWLTNTTEVSPSDPSLSVTLGCTSSHCIGFFKDFGVYPSSCDKHTP